MAHRVGRKFTTRNTGIRVKWSPMRHGSQGAPFNEVNQVYHVNQVNIRAGPVTNVLVLPKPPNLFSADTRKRPLHPFATLRKYPGADQTMPGDSPWEGPLVILPGSESRAEVGSYGTRALARLAAGMQVGRGYSIQSRF